MDSSKESLSFCDTSTWWLHIFANMTLHSCRECLLVFFGLLIILKECGERKENEKQFISFECKTQKQVYTKSTLHNVYFAWTCNSTVIFILDATFTVCIFRVLPPVNQQRSCFTTRKHSSTIQLFMTAVELSRIPHVALAGLTFASLATPENDAKIIIKINKLVLNVL